MAEPSKAQRKRADARKRRRGQSEQTTEERSDGAVEAEEEQPLESIKHAAKVAAAGAAVGAAAAAARALTSRVNDEAEPQTETKPKTESKPETRSKAQPETPPRDEQESQEPRPAQSDDEPEADGSAAVAEQRREDEVRGVAPKDARATVQQAREQLEALLDRPVESVSAFERTQDGWLVTMEVVEVSRIPESTDVLASYEMELDDDRNLRRYARARRYHRSQANTGEQA
jgi:Gas vesicle synthesis protein GvpO